MSVDMRYNNDMNENKKHGEMQYLNLMRDIINQPNWQKNRTGIRTKMLPGAMMQFDMDDGFPAITTKKLAFGAVKGELIGFLRGYTSAKQFRDLGCKIWDQNANENEAWISNRYRKGTDDLGYIYSKLWTDMPHANKDDTYDIVDNGETLIPGFRWNQIEKLLEGINKDPTSRRLIVSAWHPEVFGEAALPPCHVLFQVLIDQEAHKLHMTMYQRSCDMFLGVPFNIASYALLLHLIADATGYDHGTLTWFGADCHVYENHMSQVTEQLGRDPLPFPRLDIDAEAIKAIHGATNLDAIEPSHIQLLDYVSHPPIKAPMAI
jgi:thymidylate synthase